MLHFRLSLVVLCGCFSVKLIVHALTAWPRYISSVNYDPNFDVELPVTLLLGGGKNAYGQPPPNFDADNTVKYPNFTSKLLQQYNQESRLRYAPPHILKVNNDDDDAIVEYNRCVELFGNEMETVGHIASESLLRTVGSDVTLQCRACSYVGQKPVLRVGFELRWDRELYATEGVREPLVTEKRDSPFGVELDEEASTSIGGRFELDESTQALQLRSLQVSDSGRYYCVTKRSSTDEKRKSTIVQPAEKVVRVYDIEIVEHEKFITVTGSASLLSSHASTATPQLANVSPTESQNLASPTSEKFAHKIELIRPPFVVHGRNMIAYSKPGDWSECSTCNERGTRQRMRQCTLKKVDLSQKASVSNDAKQQNTLESLLDMFPHGLACRSRFLSGAKFHAELPILRLRPSELEVEPCLVPCPTEPSLVVVTDESGRVIETVNNAAGYYSLNQKLPPVPPAAQRRTLRLRKNVDVEIKCPNSAGKAARWQVNDTALDPLQLMMHQHGHHHSGNSSSFPLPGKYEVDFHNTLTIRNTQPPDEGTYSCWYSKQMIAVYKVRIGEFSEDNEGAGAATMAIIGTLGAISFVIIFVMLLISAC